MVRVIIASLVGAIVVFNWGYVSWEIIGWQYDVIGSVADEDAMLDAVGRQIDTTGVYWVPSPEKVEATAGQAEAQAKPFVSIFYLAPGVNPQDPMMFVRGFVIYLVAALFMSFVLVQTAAGAGGYFRRLWTLLCVALFTVLVTHGAMWCWMGYPTDYTLMQAGDVLAGWLIAGLFMAGIIRPGRRSPAHAAAPGDA